MDKEYNPVRDWCREHGYGGVVSIERVGGGCINEGAILETESGQSFFVKTNNAAPPDMFPREAEGLEALDVDDGPRVPRVYHAEASYILLEDLNPAPRKGEYWTTFGRQLAALHGHTKERFGFAHDNYIGSTPQVNPWTENGFDFFAHQRLLYQAQLGRDRRRLSSGDVNKIEHIAHHLEEWIPPQEASLIHGDLWSGNATTDEEGDPAIIDPAAHYGWAEAELAMTSLFGSFPDRFYRAYQEIRPLEPGFRDRFPIYNLYHLLNHVNLFGGGYLSQVRSILDRYA
ncbi:MAG: fructosamine kinase family protein [Anaerolineales bacterium]